MDTNNPYAIKAEVSLIAHNIVNHALAGEATVAYLYKRPERGGEALLATASKNFERKRVRDNFTNTQQTQAAQFVDVFIFPLKVLQGVDPNLVTLIAHNGKDYTVTLGDEPDARKQFYRYKIKSKRPSPAVRLDRLRGYWRLDELTGSRADYSGERRSLSAAGTLTRAAGKVGYGCEFASDGSLSLDVSSFLSAPFTLCGWFKGPLETYGDIWTLKSSVHDIDEWPITLVRNVSAFQLVLADENDASYYGPDFGNAAADTWTFLRLEVSDLRTVKVYVNETMLAESALPADLRGDWTDLVIGNALSQGNMAATQDEIALYGRLLTAAEGAAMYNQGAGLALV